MGTCAPLIYAMSVLLMVAFYEGPGACQRVLSKCDRNRKESTAQKTPQDLKATGMSLPTFIAGVYSEYLRGEHTAVIKWNRQISGGSRTRSVTCPYRFTMDVRSLNREGQFFTGIITGREIFAGSQSTKGTASADVPPTGTTKDHAPELKGKYSSQNESRGLHSAKPSGVEVTVDREGSSCPNTFHNVDRRDGLTGADANRDRAAGLQGNKREGQTRGKSVAEIFGAAKSPEAAKDHSTDRKPEENRGSESHKAKWERVVERGDKLEWKRTPRIAEERGTGWGKERHEGAPLAPEGSERGLHIAAMEPRKYIEIHVAIMTTALFVGLVLVIFTCCWIRRNRHQMDEPNAAAGDGSNKMGCSCFKNGQTKAQRNRDKGTQDGKIIHREFLLNWSKDLKVVHAGGRQTAGKRLFQDLYTDLKIIGAPPEGMPLENDGESDEGVEPHQLLKRNNSETEETSTILVRGSAGSGKSTLIQKIIHDWATENKYKEFKYIFSFKYQTLNAIKYVTNLNTLVLEAYPHLITCLEDLWKDPKTILFILDDMDQFEQSYFAGDDGNGGPSGGCMNPDCYGFVRDILTSLIQGRLVKGCSLLVTTRPWRLEALQAIPVTSTFHLTGFTPENVKEYFNRSFGDKKKAEQLVQRVEACETLGRLYLNPLFCSIVASLPEWSQVGESPMFTMGHTRVLSEYLTTIMGICGFDEQTSRQSLMHLGEAAYKKIRDKSFSFEAQSSSELNRCLTTFTSALMMETPGKGERDVVYKFTYPILQNLVAALVQSRNTPGISLKMLLNEAYTATDDRFNIFSRFLVGLSSRGSTKWLERVLGSSSPEARSSTADWIKESVKTRLSNLAGKTTQHNFLNILHCLFEFGDPQLATEALDPMRTIKFNQCSLNTFDCVVLSGTLICCGPIEELDLSSCGVKQTGIRYLQPVLCKCKVLRLKSNQLADDCLESLFTVVQTNRSLTLLDLSNCDQGKQTRNEFTAEILRTFVQNCRLQREVRWAHHEDTEQKDSKLDKASNILNIITE